MSQQSILKRFTNLIRTKINNWFDLAEDPVDNLKQRISDYSNAVDQHEKEVINVTITHDLSKLEYNEAVEELDTLEATVEKARGLIQEAKDNGDTEKEEYYTKNARIAYREYTTKKKNLELRQAALHEEAAEVEQVQGEHTELKEELEKLRTKQNNLISKLRLAQSREALEGVKGELGSGSGILKEIETQTYKLDQSRVVRKKLEDSTDSSKLKKFQEELSIGDVDDDFDDFLAGGSLGGNTVKELK